MYSSYTFTSFLNVRRHYNIYCSIRHNEIYTTKTDSKVSDFRVKPIQSRRLWTPRLNEADSKVSDFRPPRSDILAEDLTMNLLASLSTIVAYSVTKSGLSLQPLFQEGETVPGSTESILLMGILIVLIVVVPVVWSRRKWMR
jgi:hypothetical protein